MCLSVCPSGIPLAEYSAVLSRKAADLQVKIVKDFMKTECKERNSTHACTPILLFCV